MPEKKEVYFIPFTWAPLWREIEATRSRGRTEEVWIMARLCRRCRLAEAIPIRQVGWTIGWSWRNSSPSFSFFVCLAPLHVSLQYIMHSISYQSSFPFALLQGIRLPFRRLKILELYAAWKVKELYQHSSWTKTAKSMATRLSELHFKKKKKFLSIKFCTKKN